MEFLDEESKINFAWLMIMEKFQCDTKVALLYFHTFTKCESKATLPKTNLSLLKPLLPMTQHQHLFLAETMLHSTKKEAYYITTIAFRLPIYRDLLLLLYYSRKIKKAFFRKIYNTKIANT